MERIAAEGAGVISYNPAHEGRGIGLNDKLAAYALQEGELDTVDANLALGQQADARNYTVEAAILRDLGVESIRLLTNNPDKVDGLLALGIAVLRVPLSGRVNRHNYLEAKIMRLGHWPDVIS
jgi:3,4-dihydroxy 2-butanone 4-phosphate synthase/GTP cyclohydrolase II